MKKTILSLLISLFCLNAVADSYPSAEAQTLFQTYGKGRPYRIPAIAKAKNGDLIAVSDDRFCGADIGYGKVNLVYKVSHDNGKTWTPELMMAEGDGIKTSNTCGFGDAAIVADRKSNRVMVMCVSAPLGGNCWTPEQRGSILWGTPTKDGNWQWTEPIDIKDQIMALLPADRVNYFVGSGKLHQSRTIKVGKYYRVYAALWTSSGRDLQNYVVYSDDFGQTWQLLGTSDICPGPDGNEPKCEELPNGDVILSARRPGYRLLNIFHYTNAKRAEGTWDKATDGIKNGDVSGTDGEILLVKAKQAGGKPVTIALQSAPNHGRKKVSIWYKILAADTDCDTPANLGQGWTLGKQITEHSSAYSTMCLQADGRIAFFYEDGRSGVDYDMIYLPISLSELSGLEDYVLINK